MAGPVDAATVAALPVLAREAPGEPPGAVAEAQPATVSADAETQPARTIARSASGRRLIRWMSHMPVRRRTRPPGSAGRLRRHLFARVTVLVAVNGGKQPSGAPSERAVQLRQEVPSDWVSVSVAAWAGLTVAFCRQHGAGVIIRGVRNSSDLRHEYQLAAMNQDLGITTLLLPAKPGLVSVSSTVLRELGA